MARLTKYRKDARARVERGRAYPADEAFGLVKELAKAKFTESVDVSVNLGVDPRRSDQVVRGSTVLPNGTGKNVRVAVFAQGEQAAAAEEAGADIVGMEDLAESVQGGDLNFDVAIASPDAMRVVGRLGRILGPRGLMPNPKVGTVTPDVAAAVRSAKAGQGPLPDRQGGRGALPDRQRGVRGGRAQAEPGGIARRSAEGQAGGLQGPVHEARLRVLHHGSRRRGRPGFGRRLTRAA